MQQPSATPINIHKIANGKVEATPDLLAVEEPLEIRLGWGPKTDRQQASISVTMRTPGNDFELALGFLFTEGIISDYSQIANIHHCETVEREEERGNVVRAELTAEVQPDLERLKRNFYTTSSCGVCGKGSIEAIASVHCPVLPPNSPLFAATQIHELPHTLRKQQAVFEHTGGIHAAALFNTKGELLLMREDVGRHNAVDKLVGTALFKNLLPLSDCLILVSGRASFELVQKALAAGIPILAAVGAPSSLAVKLADEFGMTVLGFVRHERFNIYCGKQRIST